MSTAEEELNQQFESDCVKFDSGQGGLTRCQVNHPFAQATVYLQGAHVTHFQPKDQHPVLWMSEKSRFEKGQPIRGGIPICWPWFGPHPGQPDLPQHGFARISNWHVTKIEESGHGVQLVLSLSSEDISNIAVNGKGMEHSFELQYRITVGRIFDVELTAKNVSDKSMHNIGVALHSYFAISAVESVHIDGLQNRRYFDKLTEQFDEDPEPIRFSKETDRVYLGVPSSVTLNDEKGNRRITITSTGSDSTVVWNPWIDKAAKMDDFPDDGYQNMVCVETANALADVRTINPGEKHTVSQTIKVESL